MFSALLFLLLAPVQQEPKADRWEKDIRAFEEQDRKSPPTPGGVVFIGGSSFRLWKLNQSFPDKGYVNRGFGGSQLADSVKYAERVIVPHKPRAVALYAGDNDVAAGKSPETVRDDYKAFVKVLRGKLPEVRIVFVGIKPSPRRWALREKQQATNRLVREAQKGDDKQIFVDLWDAHLGPDGMPRKELFLADELHPSAEGYKIWAKLIGPQLDAKSNEVIK